VLASAEVRSDGLFGEDLELQPDTVIEIGDQRIVISDVAPDQLVAEDFILV